MAIQTVYFYPLSSFSYVDPDLLNNTEIIGSGKIGQELTVGPSPQVINFQVNDTDWGTGALTLGDHGLFSGPSSQELVSGITIDGVTFAAGDNLGLGYSIEVSGSDGSSNTLGLLKIDGQPVGFVATNSPTAVRPLEAGVTYTTKDGPGTDAIPQIMYDNMAYCFAADALIETRDGPVPAGRVAVGDRVLTRDHGAQPVRWVGQRHYSAADLARAPHLRPIRIRAGALGGGLPLRDLVVSPQHRVLVRSAIAQKMFGTSEVLIAAKHLCLLDGIDIAVDLTSVTYVHFMFDRHQVVFAEGAEAESLFTGPEALKAVGPAARAEILTIFPELAVPGHQAEPARHIPSGRLGRKLAIRHLRNRKPLVAMPV